MFKLVIAAVALGAAALGASPGADARDWWQLDFSTNTCHAPMSSGRLWTPEPDQVEHWLRQQGLEPNSIYLGAPKVSVYKDNNGNVYGIDMIATIRTGNTAEMVFLTTFEACERIRARALKDGMMTSRSDLR